MQGRQLILEDIERGKLKIGDRIPLDQWNKFWIPFCSRDTRGESFTMSFEIEVLLLPSVAKGFYVNSTNMENKIKVSFALL